MTKELFEKYAELKAKEKEIKAQIDEINPQILEEIKEAGADKIDSEFGSFSIAKKKKWKYSENVTRAEQIVDDTKEKEMADGTATCEETNYLVFKATKA